MKRILRWALLLVFLAALGLLPFHGEDLAKLVPVKTVIVTRSGAQYTVDVGAGVKAVGATVKEAFRRLREEVTGEVFYDTAEQVVFTDSASEAVEEITQEPELRPAAGIYRTYAEDLDPEAVGAYLDSHHSNTTLLQVRARLLAGEPLEIPVLMPAEGGFRVYE